MVSEEAMLRAKRGYAKLLEMVPDAREFINLDQLEMEDGLYCVLGQVGMGTRGVEYAPMREYLFSYLPRAYRSQEAADHGFESKACGCDHCGDEVTYEDLQEAWELLLAE